MKEMTMEALVQNIPAATDFVNAQLDEVGCSPAEEMEIDVVLDEVLSNIANYAYTPEIGLVTIQVETEKDAPMVTISFADGGIPYNPLEQEAPDVNVPLQKRKIGGLGIHLTKKLMDHVSYEYREGKNILHIHKKLS